MRVSTFAHALPGQYSGIPHPSFSSHPNWKYEGYTALSAVKTVSVSDHRKLLPVHNAENHPVPLPAVPCSSKSPQYIPDRILTLELDRICFQKVIPQMPFLFRHILSQDLGPLAYDTIASHSNILPFFGFADPHPPPAGAPSPEGKAFYSTPLRYNPRVHAPGSKGVGLR